MSLNPQELRLVSDMNPFGPRTIGRIAVLNVVELSRGKSCRHYV